MALESGQSPYTRTELVWAGKRTQVERVALPFQRVETVNAPRGGDLFSMGQRDDGWRNKLIWGDNKLVMASLLKGDPAAGIESLAGKIDLIYIDPPFDTGADFSFRTQVGDEEIEKEPSIIEQVAYRDTWGSNTDSYLQMMYERLVLMRELLTESGSIFVHMDWHVGPYVRVLLDDVFGPQCFRNEIIWYYYNKFEGNVNHFPRNHDSIFYYVKSAGFKFRALQEPREESVRQIKRKWDSQTGRIVNVKGPDGKVVYQESSERRVDDVWRLPMLQPADTSQNTGFVTQKRDTVVERAVVATTEEGDLVADFFLGSGTTAAVAQKLGRRWIGCDLGRFAVHTSRKRLLELGATFDVLNLGKYERSHWQGATLGDQLRAYVDFILALYRAEPVPGFRHLHGKKAGRAVHVGAVDSPVTFAEIDDVLAECRQTHTQAVDVLGWEWEMGLNEQVKQRAEAAGVELRLYQIPSDVMDKRAKAEDVHFYSLAYVEAQAKVVQRHTIQVQLTDFVIADMDLIPPTVRDKVKRWSDFIDYWAVDFDYKDDTFCNAWQAYRTRNRKTLDTVSATHTYDSPGAYTVLVKVVDVFGIDSTKRLEVTV